MFYSAMIKGDYSMLRYGVRDRLHQPYRKHYIDGFDDIFNKTYETGSLATYLSGSGPTIVSVLNGNAFGFKKEMETFFDANSHKWRCMILECDNVGSVVSEF
jgi:homoserine kinase